MKKFALLAVLALSILAASAQDDKFKTSALKKIEKSDAAIANPKKSEKFGTWLDRSNTFVDAATAYTSKLIADQPASLVAIPGMLGEPKAIQEAEFFGQKYSRYVYEFYDMYVDAAGNVSFWEAKAEAYPNAFAEALSALKKAKELDEPGFMKSSKAKNAVKRLSSELNTLGRNCYTTGKFQEGGEAFVQAAQAQQLIGTVDTMAIYYAGICYYEAKNYKDAEAIFNKMLEVKAYEQGLVFHYLSDCQKNLGKKEEYIKTLEDGFSMFPESSTVMGGLINAYISENESTEKLIALIEKAQSLDPSNISLFLVEAQIWEKIGNIENAYKALDKAIALDAKSLHAYYNYAVFKTIESDNLVAQANKLDLNDVETYDRMMGEVEATRIQAIKNLEKCLEIDPANQDVISFLRQIYFVCRGYDGYQTKYDEFNAAHPAQ